MQKRSIAIIFILLALTVSNSSAISYAEIQNSITITPVENTKSTPSQTTQTKESETKTADHDFKLEPKRVGPNIWCFFGALDMPTKENAGYMSNSCYIQTNNSWVLWDTGASYKFAKQAYEAMSKIAKLPVSTVILSHEHDDHWLGAGYYKERFGAKIIGPKLINERYHEGDQTRMFKTLSANDIAGTKIIKMDETYVQGTKLEIGGVKMEYIPLGQAHSEEDYCLYFPEKKVMLAADAVMNGRITSNRDGSVIGSLKALKKIKSEDWSILVPGHGFITDETAADESILYFTLIKERVLQAIEDGIDADDITKTVTLPEFKDKKMYDLLNYLNVYGAYTELEMYDEEDEEEEEEATSEEADSNVDEVVDAVVAQIDEATETVMAVAAIVAVKAQEAVNAIAEKVNSVSTDKSKQATEQNSTSTEWNYNLTPKKVSENVWCFFGALEMPTKENAGNMSNNCYIKTDFSWVLWDSGPSYVFAKQAYAAMSKIAKLPVSYVILSHEHDDHWLGNNYYKEVHGAQIIGPKSINEHYHAGDQTRMFKILPANAIKNTEIINVDASYPDTISFNISGVDFEYVPVGQGHSIEDYFLYMPKDKVIFAGDLVMNGRITSNRDGSVIGSLHALNIINSKDWKTLIPGHGFITDKKAIDESELYFSLTKERVLKAIEDGVDIDDITKTVTLPEFKDKKMYDLLNYLNVYGAYTELEMYDEDEDEENE